MKLEVTDETELEELLPDDSIENRPSKVYVQSFMFRSQSFIK